MENTRQERLTTWLLLLLPFAVYGFIAENNSLDVPYWDDYPVILVPLDSGNWLTPNESHLPLITRGFAKLQIIATGAINFRWGTLIGNLGLMITAGVLVFYLNKKHRFSLESLLPIPYLLLSISHWGAMHFMVPAWQFYWGAALLPLLTFIAIIEQRCILAAFVFAAALFTSSGSIALYPIALAFLLLKKNRRDAWLFGATGGFFLILFLLPQYLFLQQTELANNTAGKNTFNLFMAMPYSADFMGSLLPNTEWNSKSNQSLHIVIGLFLILAGTYRVFKTPGCELLKGLFIYTLLLAAMAFYLRADDNPYIPSRYSLFSLMAAMSVSLLFIHHWTVTDKSRGSGKDDYRIKLVTWLSVFIWAWSIHQCKIPLMQHKVTKIQAVQDYLDSENPAFLRELAPDPEAADQQLKAAAARGAYTLQAAHE